MRMRRVISVAGLLLVAVVSMRITCSDEKQSTVVKVTDFCLAANDVSGWTVWANECTAWQASDLQSTNTISGGIDGGADVYITRGLIDLRVPYIPIRTSSCQ